MRGLSNAFMNDLKSGILFPFLELVRADESLSLEIREESINIYYCGGSLIRIDHKPSGYEAFFDPQYRNFPKTRVPNLPTKLVGAAEVEEWMNAVPHQKHEMGLWISKKHKYEREAQQLMVRENNFSSKAKQTDYYICDIEYAWPDGRFDLIAVHWSSTGHARQNPDDLDLAFIEMKYGDDALAGAAGIQKHIQDVVKYVTPSNLQALKAEMLQVFNQKLDLKLLQAPHPVRSFSDRKPELILALANHDPAPSALRNELLHLDPPDDFPVDVKVAVANFLGYGLFEQSVFPLEEFKRRFTNHI